MHLVHTTEGFLNGRYRKTLYVGIDALFNTGSPYDSIGEAHLKSPSPALARPMPIGHGRAWASFAGFGHVMGAYCRPAFELGRHGQS